MNIWFIVLQFILVVGARGYWDEFVGLRGAALVGGQEAHDDLVSLDYSHQLARPTPTASINCHSSTENRTRTVISVHL